MTDHLITFLDETGHASSSALVGVAGFVATTSAWNAFDLTWREALARAGVSGFHARQFAHSFGEFAGWSGDEPGRRRFLRGLLEAITKARLVPIAVLIAAASPERIPASHHQHLGDPYRLCLLAAARRAIDHARSLDTARIVDFVVARTSEYRGEAWHVRDLLLADPGRGGFVGPLRLGDAREIPALQAADLLAYETAKEIGRLATSAASEPRWPFQALTGLTDRRPFFEVLDQEDLLPGPA